MIWVRRAADHVHAAWGRRCKGERGASLIIAMGFLGLLSVSVVSMLVLTMANYTTTTTVRSVSGKTYGADGGADVALQLLRSDSSYCPDAAAGPQSLPAQSINDKTVTLSCETLSGSTGGGGGGGGVTWPTTYPLVLTGYNGHTNVDTFKTSGSTGQTRTLTIDGPAFNAGGFTFSGGTDRFVFSGDLHQHNPYCATNNPPSDQWKPKVLGTWSCENAGSFPVPDPNPTLKVPTTAAPAKVVQGNCTIFFPGRYTAEPKFDTAKAYLASGVYYFHDIGSIVPKGQVFGGEPGPTDTKKFTANTPCSTDAAAKVLRPTAAINGYGVQLVFGGGSQFKPDPVSSTQIELYARVPGVPANEGTPYVSFFAPKTSGPNYNASTADAFDAGGPAFKMVIHGLTYMPNAYPRIWGINNSLAGGAAPFSGGVVVAGIDFAIDSTMTSGTFAGLPGATPAPATDRTVVVTATATASGEVSTTVKAVVLIPADGSAPTVQSWRKV